MSKKAIIIGAGPAGLTAAYELLKRTDIKPIILEKSGDIGGISKTINYKGNRMDIGGHRFFSKSDRVMTWWLNIMPLEKTNDETVTINYQNKTHSIYNNTYQGTGEPVNPGLVMLIRNRLSRIYFLRKFFNYPIQLSIDTLRKLGFIRTICILLSYLSAQLIPRKPEKSLEDFLINRFGRELYLLFFKDYTEKVWGVPCNEISAEWGAQRIKGVSISKAIQHAAQAMFKKKNLSGDISQKDTETSLIEQFLYPALGPGQLWEEVARQIEILGGTILMHQDVKEIKTGENKVTGVIAVNSQTGETTEHEGDFFFSTMPVQELIAGMNASVPDEVKEVAEGLQYRDFITVGVLLEQLSTSDIKSGEFQPLDLKDTWIYIQEKDVKVGRLQFFNNWSPYMVNKPGHKWIGMEYFCNKGDEFWNLSDDEIKRAAISELEKMGLARVGDVLDSTVHRVEKTYPAYFGTYNQFDKIRAFVDKFTNLFLVGRNGMHKYNNSDHSMLTAMTSVDNICDEVPSKENIWAINTEQEYHEEKAMADQKEETAMQKRRQKPSTAFHPNQLSFRDFLLGSNVNRLFLICSAIAIIVQFTVFKFLYPTIGFIMGDSYVYLDAALNNYSINLFPIGYSNFLRLFSAFTKSDLALAGFQYIFIQASILWFLFTSFYFYKPAKVIQVTLLCFLVLNPLFLFVSNYVMSDALFLPLSVIWFTILIWIIHKPNNNLIFFHSIVLLLAFTVRYNALFYPLVAGLAFIISRQKLRLKFAGLLPGLVFIGLFILYTGNKYEKLTGTWQFSPFSGWQMANNALYTYRYIDSVDRKSVPKRFEKLDNMVRNYFDSTRDVSKYPTEMLVASTIYMWSGFSPLRIYMKEQFKNDSIPTPLNVWAGTAPILNDYGKWLIKEYPTTFFENYLWPNAIKYYTPPTEFLAYHNMGFDSIGQLGRYWFEIKDKKVKTKFNDLNVPWLEFYPIVCGAMNFIFLGAFVCFMVLGGARKNKILTRGLLVAATFWLFNFGFSVFASPIALRFQVFPSVVSITFGLLLVEYLIKEAFSPISRPEVPNMQHSVANS